MPHGPGPDYEKQARETVARLTLGGDGPGKAAALITQLIGQAARSSKDPHAVVVAVCRGAMDGAHISGQSLPETAIKVLESLPNMSLMMRSGPEELMSWVMEGIAEVTPGVGGEVRDAIHAKIEEKFMGAVFDGLCQKAFQKARGGA
ncbi:MAG: hypothetical protein HY077_04405 [Elusimicrobia bacterium]|nr:hypothetical protein [Elusimicrobiota bacterium]